MTKSRDIVKRINREAKAHGLVLVVEREGGNHTVYDLDGVTIPIPRHADVGERLTETIYKQCETKLGKGWWRR